MKYEIIRQTTESTYLIKTTPGIHSEDTSTLEFLRVSKRTGLTQACTYKELMGITIESEIEALEKAIEIEQERIASLLERLYNINHKETA